MKVSQLLYFIGLASAAVLPERGDPALVRRDPVPDPALEHVINIVAQRTKIKRDLVARRIEAWNSFSTTVSGLDACVVLQALKFLAASLIEPASDITTEAGTQVFVTSEGQGGPLVLTMRSMMIWQSILDRFKDQLQVTNTWSLRTQAEVASCYLGYSQQAGLFLQALVAHSGDFSAQDPARCLMFDKIQGLYISYNNVANRIYGGNQGVPVNQEYLITGNFQTPPPEGYETPYRQPAAGEPINNYIARYDTPEASSQSLFQRSLDTWRCADFNQLPAFNVPPPDDENGANAAPATLAAARLQRFEGKADPKIEELGRKLGKLKNDLAKGKDAAAAKGKADKKEIKEEAKKEAKKEEKKDKKTE